jgi:hypothetical protein
MNWNVYCFYYYYYYYYYYFIFFLQAISVVDWGSYIYVKRGTAGVTAEKDKFPLFNKNQKFWVQLVWEDAPHDWVLFLLEKPFEQCTVEDIDAVPEERQLFVRDITEVYLELAPSASFRIYFAPDASSAGGQQEAAPGVVLRLTPVPGVRSHAAQWVDAIYSAMQLQTHEPSDEVCLVAVVYAS